jgi:peptidoglycan/xylan/chitin deacetylase (PgdA/CDA1 family)
MASVAILTYHPIHIIENSYSGNDLLALEQDLATIERLGIPVRSLDQLLTPPDRHELLGDAIDGPAVAITFDDGAVFDYVDHMHPTCGPQVSAASVLEKCAARYGTLAGAWPRASTFVIASPGARAELDRKDYFGGNYWPDDWWREARERRILGVESHSWDHNHPSLERTAQRDNARGTFRNIETHAEAEAEIAQSVRYIGERAGVAPRFFAYPWGEANDFLAREYLPTRGVELGLWAALGTTGPAAAGYVTRDTDRWLVPRFVFGHDWRATAELATLLEGLRG